LTGGHLVTVYTRAGCHLCAEAIATASALATEAGAGFTTVDAEYGDLVPVIMVDGVLHGYYQVDTERLRAALAG
jgi:hypothetical protein